MEDFDGVLNVKREAIETEGDFVDSEVLTSQELDAVFGLDIEDWKPGPLVVKNENDDKHEELLYRNVDIKMEDEDFKPEAVKREEEFEESEKLTCPEFDAVFLMDNEESKPDLDSLHYSEREKFVETKSESESAQEPQTCQLPEGARARQGTNSNLKIDSSQRLNIFQCDECGFTSQNRTGIRKHIEIRHSVGHQYNFTRRIQAKPTTERPHKCPNCDFACTQKSNLKSHIQAKHSMVRPHQCPDCDFACVQKSHLKKHIQAKHTTVRPH